MLGLQEEERRVLWARLVEILEEYAAGVGTHRVSPELNPARIREALARFDFATPCDPVPTAGTTNAGAVDPLGEVAAVAQREGLWCHVDAAWGGAAALSASLRPVVEGMALGDSITFDAHKWLSAPMGAGLFLTRHREILSRTFATLTAYMPKEAEGLDVTDPHLHSMQWSRRFIGLKVFLTLAASGWAGIGAAVDEMAEMGALLRRGLKEQGWRILNDTPLPVVCFDDPGGANLQEIAGRVVGSGDAWISTTRLAGSRLALRACITNFRTSAGDVEALVSVLERCRA